MGKNVNVNLVAQKDLTCADVNTQAKDMMTRFTFEAWDEMIEEADSTWCILDTRPTLEMTAFGRYRFMELYDQINSALAGELEKVRQKIESAAQSVAKSINREFNMTITYPELITKESYIEVPHEIKKFIFFTETVYTKERRVECSYDENRICFNGWLIEAFQRVYQCSFQKIVIKWDYCLGVDGEIYCITSVYHQDYTPKENTKIDFSYTIRKALPFNNGVLENKNQMSYIFVSHGLLYALAVRPDKHIDTFKIDRGQEKYTYNFPIQPNGNELRSCTELADIIISKIEAIKE